MRLSLVISSLSCGGAERVMSIMASYWAERGWGVTLMTFDDGSLPPFYKLHHAVRHVPLGIAVTSTNPAAATLTNLRRVTVLRRALRHSEPDVVISFMDAANILTLIANIGRRWPVVVSERTDPSLNPIHVGWRALRRQTYPYAAAVVVQSEGARSFFGASTRCRTTVIPNPIVPPGLSAIRKSHGREKRLVTLGRLSAEKGIDLLIHAFARVAVRHPEWSLVIWGEGEERPVLENLRDELRLSERIILPGRTSEPEAELSQADLYVLSSRFEGFPNALCEAMACGLPVISFDCPSGPREIIRNAVDGVLVPPGDVEALATAMDRLMSSATERNRLASRAIEVVERFSLAKVMGMWERLLYEAVQRWSI